MSGTCSDRTFRLPKVSPSLHVGKGETTVSSGLQYLPQCQAGRMEGWESQTPE